MRKRWLWSLSVALVLLALLVLLVPALVPGDKIAGYLARRIHEATGADVVLGSVRVRAWPTVRVTLGRGSLAGDLGDTGLETVRWRDLAVDMDLVSLLRGKAAISAADVHGLSLAGTRDGRSFQLRGCRVHAGGLELTLDSQGRRQLPPGMRFPLEFRAETFVLQSMEFRDLVGQGVVTADSLRLDPVRAHLGAGDVEASVTLALDDVPARFVRFSTTVRAVPASILMVDFAPELGAGWEGDLDGTARGNFLVQGGELVRESLAVEGRLAGAAGVVHARQWLDAVAGYLGSRQDLMDIRYDHLEQPFAIHDGWYQLDLEAAGPETDWSATGSVGLDGELDLSVLVKLPSGFTPDLGSYSLLAGALRDRDGRMTLALDISGKVRRPRVAVNLGKSLQGISDGAGSDRGKGLDGLLDKLKVR